MLKIDYVTILFITLFLFMVLGSVFMLIATNPVHAILFLILVFVCAIEVLLIVGVEFLALVFIIVYVGAIAVLFLFVVMMLNMQIMELEESFFRYMPIGFLTSIIVYLEIDYLISYDYLGYLASSHNIGINEVNLKNIVEIVWFNFDSDSNIKNLNDLYLLGQIIYCYYFMYILIASCILLVAMIGAISLTLNYVIIVKRQDIYQQISKSVVNSLKYIKKNNKL